MVQGLKSLVSKLHPQLPLSPKESQRLLTALTSSFRKQLDEVYPRQAQDEDVRPKVDQGRLLKSPQHGLHTSSVAFADKHLASVLTNPLLVRDASTPKTTLNYESAKLALEQNPDNDPISVLEEYHEKGAATIAIADICLRAFIANLGKLSEDERRLKVAEIGAGRRTLKWLWASELHTTNEFVDDRKLMSALVSMLIEEDMEHFLWSWLRLDVQLGTETKSRRDPWNQRNHRYRWKDFMVRLLILHRHNRADGSSVNDMMDTWLKGVDLRLEVENSSQTNCVPLSSAGQAMIDHMFACRHLNNAWDVKRYDRCIGIIHVCDNPQKPHWAELKKANLMLSHPQRPTPLPMYQILRESFSAKPGSDKALVWDWIVRSRSSQREAARIQVRKYHLLLETARQLQDRGENEEKEWILSQIDSNFPVQAKYKDRDLKTARKPPPPTTPRHPLQGYGFSSMLDPSAPTVGAT